MAIFEIDKFIGYLQYASITFSSNFFSLKSVIRPYSLPFTRAQGFCVSRTRPRTGSSLLYGPRNFTSKTAGEFAFDPLHLGVMQGAESLSVSWSGLLPCIRSYEVREEEGGGEGCGGSLLTRPNSLSLVASGIVFHLSEAPSHYTYLKLLGDNYFSCRSRLRSHRSYRTLISVLCNFNLLASEVFFYSFMRTLILVFASVVYEYQL